MMTVMFCSLMMLSTALLTAPSDVESNADVARDGVRRSMTAADDLPSSSMRIDGRRIKALAMLMRCRWPPDKLDLPTAAAISVTPSQLQERSLIVSKP